MAPPGLDPEAEAPSARAATGPLSTCLPHEINMTLTRNSLSINGALKCTVIEQDDLREETLNEPLFLVQYLKKKEESLTTTGIIHQAMIRLIQSLILFSSIMVLTSMQWLCLDI
ncbi:hypothetical protein CEXT_97351 [Caerostris extrusa]|uniref:Uncharacterized protein n=1 Tax=Caerostris extrusa TaxID=172846 RepID=A0AAV4S1P4_CAEEX|nr:hypothetical protein CEXT_97351 [Caerostris extrusa]